MKKAIRAHIATKNVNVCETHLIYNPTINYFARIVVSDGKKISIHKSYLPTSGAKRVPSRSSWNTFFVRIIPIRSNAFCIYFVCSSYSKSHTIWIIDLKKRKEERLKMVSYCVLGINEENTRSTNRHVFRPPCVVSFLFWKKKKNRKQNSHIHAIRDSQVFAAFV